MAMKVIMARDPLFEDVKKFVKQQKVASSSVIQRRFMLGFKYGESKKSGFIRINPQDAGVPKMHF